jgi:signal transduction histidine kinase
MARKPAKILICSSSDKALDSIKKWCTDLGEIFTCNSAAKALKLIETEKPELFISAAHLKDTHVEIFLQEVRTIDNALRICLILDKNSYSKMEAFIAADVDRFIAMPLRKSKLLGCVDKLLCDLLPSEEHEVSQESIYQQIIEKGFVVSHHDKEGHIISANSAFYELFNVNEGLKDLDPYNPLFSNGALDTKTQKELKEHKTARFRKSLHVTGSGEKILDVTMSCVEHANGEEELLSLIEDVTDVVMKGRANKKSENEQKLERLMMQKRHNEEINKIKDSFLTVFTHELRTPLNAILNFSEHVHKQIGKESFKKKEQLQEEMIQIRHSGLQILEMIDNVLLAMTLRDKGVEVHRQSCQIHYMIHALLSSNTFKEEGVNIELDLDETLSIESDNNHFNAICNNLFSNAVKYGEGRIWITCKAITQEKFELLVEDDGAGFKDTKSVFNLFEQSDSDAMTRVGKGAGVGLFVVKKLCELLDYTIELDTSKHLGGAAVRVVGSIKDGND